MFTRLDQGCRLPDRFPVTLSSRRMLLSRRAQTSSAQKRRARVVRGSFLTRRSGRIAYRLPSFLSCLNECVEHNLLSLVARVATSCLPRYPVLPSRGQCCGASRRPWPFWGSLLSARHDGDSDYRIRLTRMTPTFTERHCGTIGPSGEPGVTSRRIIRRRQQAIIGDGRGRKPGLSGNIAP